MEVNKFFLHLSIGISTSGNGGDAYVDFGRKGHGNGPSSFC